MAETTYLTIAHDGEAEIEVKRSRFRCHLARVESEEAARLVVEAQRRQHWDARHHCSAFVLGPDASVQRSSDDGEPSGTAGAPMLEVLRGHELSDVVAVVTRWFGGVLLGTGGLVRAYGDAVRAGVDAVGTSRRSLLVEHELTVPHADAGRIEHELRSRGTTVLETTYATEATLHLGVPPEDETGLAGVIAELTGGASGSVRVGSRWVDGPGRSE